MAKKYYTVKELSSLTEAFERHLFGTVAGIAKAVGVKAEIVEFDDEAEDGYCRAILRGQSDLEIDEVFYRLWERFEITEWNWNCVA